MYKKVFLISIFLLGISSLLSTVLIQNSVAVGEKAQSIQGATCKDGFVHKDKKCVKMGAVYKEESLSIGQKCILVIIIGLFAFLFGKADPLRR